MNIAKARAALLTATTGLEPFRLFHRATGRRCAIGQLASVAGMSDDDLRQAAVTSPSDYAPDPLALVAASYEATSWEMRVLQRATDQAPAGMPALQAALDTLDTMEHHA